jgi:hypothetical protein
MFRTGKTVEKPLHGIILKQLVKGATVSPGHI